MCDCNSEQVYKMAEKVLTDLINTQPHICSCNSEQVKIEYATKSKTIISSKILTCKTWNKSSIVFWQIDTIILLHEQ